MAYNNAILAIDPQAIEKLTEKLEDCEKKQASMKDLNAYWRRYGSFLGYPGISDEVAEIMDKKCFDAAPPWGEAPYSSYDLSSNNAEINRLKQRIAEITRNRDVGFTEWKFEGGKAVANTELNRLQLIFDERPDKEKHNTLRHAGFVYSHANGAYQRQLNSNAIYATNRIDFVKPLDGRRPTELQPKAATRDTGAR